VNTPRSNTTMRVSMAAVALLGWSALVLQFPLSLATSHANGLTTGEAILTYFSFFTILTNLVAAASLTLPLLWPNLPVGRFFSRPDVIAGVTVAIAMVGLGYSLLLRQLWAPEGLQKIADVVLHDLVPVLYVAYWLIFVPKIGLRWKSVLLWQIYPLAYLALVLLRGALSGRYPYPFIDAAALGYDRVLFNAAMLLCAFLAVGLILVAISRWMERGPAAGARQIN